MKQAFQCRPPACRRYVRGRTDHGRNQAYNVECHATKPTDFYFHSPRIDMKTFVHLYRYYRRGGYHIVPAMKRASRAWSHGF
jgi:hypothetical protein